MLLIRFYVKILYSVTKWIFCAILYICFENTHKKKMRVLPNVTVYQMKCNTLLLLCVMAVHNDPVYPSLNYFASFLYEKDFPLKGSWAKRDRKRRER